MSAIIRKAHPHEFHLLTHIHYQTFLQDPTINLLWKHCTPSSIRNWYFPKPSDEFSTVLVAQEQESEEVVGLVWYLTMSHKNAPTVRKVVSFPEGYNMEESTKMRGPRMAWQNDLLNKYGEYICESIPFLTALLVYLTDTFVIQSSIVLQSHLPLKGKDTARNSCLQC
jgi:hypothetical protein